jgi:hypothetical protein
LKRKLPNRIRYIPGIISLIVVPFLLIFFVRHYSKSQIRYAIPIVWPDLELVDMYKESYVAYRGHFPPLRNYITLRLDENIRSNQAKLDFAAIEAEELVKSHDTLNGIHFVFDNEASYEDFIKAVDICRISGAKTYMPYKNNLWVYNLPVIPKAVLDSVQELYCGTASMMVKHEKIENISITKAIPVIWSTSWPIMAGFVILVLFSIRGVVLRNKKIRLN